MSTAMTEHTHSTEEASGLLRTGLRIDSWGTAVFGVVMLVSGSWLSSPLGIPAAWFVPVGVEMVGGATALGLIAGYPDIPSRLALYAIAGNGLSAVAILSIMFAGVAPLTAPGVAFMLIGALWVTVFAGFQYVGLQRSGVPVTAAAETAARRR